MKKYMFVIITLSNGGAERVISVLSSAITKQDCESCIVKYYDTENEYPVSDKVRIINLSKGKLVDYQKIGYIEKVKRLRKIIKEEKPDFVIPFLFPVALCVAIASKGLRTTVIQSIRIHPALGPTSKLLRKLRDYLVYRSKCTFVQNEAQKQYFSQKYQKNIHVLFNPISEELLSAEWKPMKDKYIVSGVGRLEKQKNFKLLIKAFQQAFMNVPKTVLYIYGEGSQMEELRRYADSLGMGERICLMGRSNNIKKVYEESSLFVLSSDFEGMPNALIEAMAVGTPCVSTDCPTGPTDLIVDGINGWLVPIADTDAMARSMKRAFERKDGLTAMSKAAKETIKHLCAADEIAKQMIEICESII